jgi:hypothetical protein
MDNKADPPVTETPEEFARTCAAIREVFQEKRRRYLADAIEDLGILSIEWD